MVGSTPAVYLCRVFGVISGPLSRPGYTQNHVLILLPEFQRIYVHAIYFFVAEIIPFVNAVVLTSNLDMRRTYCYWPCKVVYRQQI